MKYLAFVTLFTPSLAYAVACPSFDADLGSAVGQNVDQGNTCGQGLDAAGSCGSSGAAEDVAYKWTSPANGSFTFTTDGSQYDTVLHIQDMATCTEIDCDDDGGGYPISSIVLNATARTEYIVNVDGFSANCGLYQLNIEPAFTLVSQQITAGQSFDAEVVAGPPNSTVYIMAASTAGYTCHPQGAPCVDLASPRVVGRINTNNQGEGVVTITAPARLPRTIYLQAISVNPALASNVYVQ